MRTSFEALARFLKLSAMRSRATGAASGTTPGGLALTRMGSPSTAACTGELKLAILTLLQRFFTGFVKDISHVFAIFR